MDNDYRIKLNELKDKAVDIRHGKSWHAPEENDADGLVHRTSAPKSYQSIMFRVVQFLESLGFKVDPEACSWKSITGINGYFQIDVQLLNPKTTAAVSSNLDSAARHELALENYARTGKWVEPTSQLAIPGPVDVNSQRAIAIRQSREVSTYTNVMSLSEAIKTEYAFCVSAIHQSGLTCMPIYGEVTPTTDLADAVMKAIKMMLRREPRVALGWAKPPPPVDDPPLKPATIKVTPAPDAEPLTYDI